jgi:hypothetical protein
VQVVWVVLEVVGPEVAAEVVALPDFGEPALDVVLTVWD